MKDLPSEEELLANRMKDGSRPPMHSKELYDKYVKNAFGVPLPDELREKSPEELTAAELEFEADLMLLDDLDYCRDMGRYMANTGRAALEVLDSPAGDRSTELTAGGRESAPSTDDNEEQSSEETATSADADNELGSSQQPTHTSSARQGGAATSDAHVLDDFPYADYGDDTDEPDDHSGSPGLPAGAGDIGGIRCPYPPPPPERKLPDGTKVPNGPVRDEKSEQEQAKKKLKQTKLLKRYKRSAVNSGKRASNAAIKKLTRSQAAGMIHHGCKLILSVAEKRAEVFKRLVKHAMQQDLKEAFYWDRAHAVVASTLLHLDKEFEDVGFGSWMPFRFPDQWLMFCGVLQRVLAANGLIHAKDPEQYRKLLDETDAVLPEIRNIDERIDWWRTPENWSTLYCNRGARTMSILKQRLTDEVWDPTTEFGGTRAPPENPG